MAMISTGTGAHYVSISSRNVSSVTGPSGTPTSISGGGLNQASVGDTQRHLFVLPIELAASDVSVIVWWCAILMKGKCLILIERMNDR
jgi:hypothetical protein